MPILLAIIAIVSVIIGGNVVSNQSQQNTQPTPIPVQETYIETPQNSQQDTSTTAPAVQGIQETKVLPPSSLVPTSNPDPLVTCNSKTGKITVRLSICKSYTDCPDGSGGYIFESQAACKSRWENIGKQFKNITDDYIKAIKERGELESLQRQLQTQQFDNELKNKLQQQSQETDQFIKDLENKSSVEYQRILQEQSDSFKNFIKTPTPTPCPQGWYGAEIDVPGPCGN